MPRRKGATLAIMKVKGQWWLRISNDGKPAKTIPARLVFQDGVNFDMFKGVTVEINPFEFDRYLFDYLGTGAKTK